ncbi:MAG: type II toxin-antitoxin system death-on-curing family toxin [Nitrosopumilus sp. H13]|nr:MAG: type II toxin-antitoxin system death-on-curing family toxin [Nitrosopumilus sp. H13]
MTFKDLTPDKIFRIHDFVVKKYKIDGGFNNKGTVESLLEKIQFLEYDDVYKNGALLLEGLARLHPFVDGNKRTALLSLQQYLNQNGHLLFLPLSTTAFLHKIAATEENDPENTEKLVKEIGIWLKNNSVTEKKKLRALGMFYAYYVWPTKLIVFFSRIHLPKVAGFILKKYLKHNVSDLDENMIEFIMDTQLKQMEFMAHKEDS